MSKSNSVTQNLALHEINVDDTIQQRVKIDCDTVKSYAEDMKAGAKFPPVIVFKHGNDYYLADGCHRIEAAKLADLGEIKADVREGSYRDAKLYACSANIKHGLRRTNADKRKAIKTLLKDDEWRCQSDTLIGNHCGAHHQTVGKVRALLRKEIAPAKLSSASQATDGTFKKVEIANGTISEENEETASLDLRKTADGRVMNVAKIRAANTKRGRQSKRTSNQEPQQKTDSPDGPETQAVDHFLEGCRELHEFLPDKINQRDVFQVMARARDLLIRCLQRLDIVDARNCVLKIRDAFEQTKEEGKVDAITRPAYPEDPTEQPGLQP